MQVLAGKQAKTAGLYGALTGVSQFALSSSMYGGSGSSSKKLPRQAKGNVRPSYMGGGTY